MRPAAGGVYRRPGICCIRGSRPGSTRSMADQGARHCLRQQDHRPGHRRRGRQTHVPGVSSRAASAQGKPCRSRAGTGMRRASGTGGRTAPSTTRPAGPGTGASCAAVMARRARNAPEGRPSVPSPGAARRRRRHCGRRTARSRKGRPGRDHGDPPARAGRSAAMSRVRHEASGGNPSCMIAAIPAKM